MKTLINKISKIDNSVDLNAVIDAVKTQQKRIKALEIAKAKMSLSVGDKVKINAKDQVFFGSILRINRTKAVCSIEGRSGTFDVPLRIMEAV
tara:strand:- start:1414 stop:1689 length:276 start_codon:yes stop_codon:yes gene_type:complete